MTSKNVWTKEDTVKAKKDFAKALNNLADAFALVTQLLPDDLKPEFHAVFLNNLHGLILDAGALDFELGERAFATFFNSALKRVAARHKMSTDL